MLTWDANAKRQVNTKYGEPSMSVHDSGNSRSASYALSWVSTIGFF